MQVSRLRAAESCGLELSPRSPFRPLVASHAVRLCAASSAPLTYTNTASRTPFDLMQRTSTTAAARKHLWGQVAPAPEQSTGWADWLFEEADALNQQTHTTSPSNRPGGLRSHLHGTSHLNDFTARDAVALLPLLSLHGDAVFAEVGLRCRGRLPLNLALNCPTKEYMSVCPDLQLTVDSSQLCSPILQAGITKCPVTFICAEPHNFHFNGITHVLLHNRAGDGMDKNTCRTIAAKLAASPTFQVLLSTAPLPFQHHLIYVGDANLHPSNPPGSSSSRGKDSTRRMLSADALESPTLHIYATSFEAAPIGTIASLYCQTGMCCLPGNALHAISRHVVSESQTEGKRQALLELPPLAVHTAAYQDLCSGTCSSR